MATQIKFPKASPLDLMFGGEDQAAPLDDDAQGVLDELVGTVTGTPDQRWKDEQLAFASGMTDPTGSGDFGRALTNAFGAQSQQRNKDRELRAMYLPSIVTALAQQRQLQMQRQQMQRAMAWAEQLHEQFPQVPREAIQSDLLFNGGKNIRDMIFKVGSPDIRFQDGAVFDANALGRQAATGQGGPGGFMGFAPGVSMSASGQTIARTPDGRGGLRVFAPEGATDAFREFQDIGARSTARYKTQTVTPRGENPQLLTEEDLADQARARARAPAPRGLPRRGDQGSELPPSRPGDKGLPQPDGQYRGAFEGDVRQVLQAIEAIKDPQERANALQAYYNQLGGRNPPRDDTPTLPTTTVEAPGDEIGALEQQMREAQDRGNVAEAQRLRSQIEQLKSPKPSLGLELQSPAEAKRAEGAVETETKQYQAQAGEARKAKTAVAQLERAIQLLEQGSPTSSGIGSLRDEAYAFVGKESGPAAQARELATIQGWLTSNVPRMEGPQSNFDVMNYQQMTGMVGNEKLPINVRLAAAKQAAQMIKDAAPKTFGAGWGSDGGSSQIPTATPFQISPDIIKAERARRQKGK